MLWIKPAACASRLSNLYRTREILVQIYGILQIVIGGILFFGGAYLLSLDGSSYYVVIGVIFVVSGMLIRRRQMSGVWIQISGFLFTVGWALWEVGPDFWPLVPRLVVPAVLAALTFILTPVIVDPRPSQSSIKMFYGASGLLILGLLSTAIAAFFPHGEVHQAAVTRYLQRSPTVAASASTNWSHYGRTPDGTRFAPFDQISQANVKQLEVAWVFNTGDVGKGEDQNVPLQIGSLVYSCSRSGRLAALDVDTGEVKWRFDARAFSPVWQRCRGLGYHDEEKGAVAATESKLCAQRIIQTTIDARLIAVDAHTGKLCPNFGDGGVVNLAKGMGLVKPGFYFQTSAPTVVRDLVVIGGWVRDNQERGEPSGVVRAFNARTGGLVWAWDLGNSAVTLDPPAGQSYTRGTPNMWSTPAFDDKLGLIYLPLGNATPDYYGNGRTAESERYSSSIVALDIDTGRPRWNFQTVHHDLWDYDVAPQPALFDAPDAKGGTIPALLQATKRGQLFLLDRSTGKPLANVIEKAVPQAGKAPSEWLSATQPYSVGMPSVGTEPLSESRMWGATIFDQLWCRIEFRKHRYEGEFTPPGLTASIEYPGNYGGFNWGGVSLDAANGFAFLNDIRLPVKVRLMPPEEAKVVIAAAASKGAANRHGPALQAGTPYGVLVEPMMSPLGIPCVEPPFGTITAVDLRTRQVAWQVPMGTVEDTGPLGIRTHLKMPIGMPTIGGTLATAGGLVFFAGSQDFYLRALNASDGHELWRSRLPVGSGSTPMTYISPKSHRQYVLISAGGASGSTTRGDYLVAYALPQSK